MRIGFDIDGVILDFERTMNSYAEIYDLLILKRNGVCDSNQFDYLKRYNWSLEERNEFLDKYLLYATINKTPLIPLIKEMLELLVLEDNQIFFITARGLLKEETKSAVIEVFKRNNLPVNNIYFKVLDKVKMCQELGIDVMVEDNPEICEALCANKIKTLYFKDVKSRTLKQGDYLKEVANVGEILRYILNNKELKNSRKTYERVLLKNSE